MEFLALFRQVGFTNSEFVAQTGFNSSPVTKGALFRATKPVIPMTKEQEKPLLNSLSKYQEFFAQAYAEGAIDRKTKHLIALGASLGAGCEA